ncbi:MAG: hypothetical protein KatS3mg108_3436 [Isosphaeraceae bacterium]|jgi:serine/threonine-protein kinase|nr:MAG: hypothetical protein KatS3mg108_3436 [Isosphaeraceae bacterium]
MSETLVGQQLGSFRIEGELGAGAMGVVYRATYLKTNQPAAVKVIHLGQLGRGNADQRFDREAEILKQFRHPNIVRLLAYGRSKGTPYIGMEFIDGRTLEAILLREEIIDWVDVIRYGIQICEALQYAHERGVVHRDLKPSNLMITSSGQVKLTDFGIAKDLDATALTATNRTLGTAAYMAPEQIRGHREITHKTDLYALGCVLYQMLTGKPPFQGSGTIALMNAHLNAPPPRPSEKMPRIPRALDDLVVSLMAKSVTERPWDAQAVAQTLKSIEDQLRRGEPIKMVFGPPYVADEVQPTLLTDSDTPASLANASTLTSSPATPGPRPALPSFEATAGSPTVIKKKRKKKRKPAERRPLSLGTLGLAGGLVAVLALIVWLAWPPSAEQLVERARPLMATDDPARWDDAERLYLRELDRRFPEHAYRDEVQAFRDKVLLTRTRTRAQRLLRGRLDPRNDLEELYLRVAKVAEAATESGLDDQAVRQWKEAAAQFQADTDPDARGWALLAAAHATEAQQRIERHRTEATTLLSRAKQSEAEAAAAISEDEANQKREMSIRLLRQVLTDYGRFPYLAEILAAARAALADAGEPIPEAENPPIAPESQP